MRGFHDVYYLIAQRHTSFWMSSWQMKAHLEMFQYMLWGGGGGERKGEFVVRCIYFMATDFKQISDYPYCLIICLGGWAIYEMLAFQMLEQCALNAVFINQPPKCSTLAVSNLWIQNKCWRKEHLQSCVVSITSLKCIYKWSRQRSKCLQKNCYFINIFLLQRHFLWNLPA